MAKLINIKLPIQNGELVGVEIHITPLINIKQLSKRIGIPIKTIYDWVRDRKIPDACIVHLNTSLRFDVQEVQKWINGGRRKPLPTFPL